MAYPIRGALTFKGHRLLSHRPACGDRLLNCRRAVSCGVSHISTDRLFVALGGTFPPFSDSKLKELYPNHGKYVSAVAKAAQAALNARYILEEDKDLYVKEAAQSDIGK
ncbi:MAG: hypothetical protein HYZ72_18595 [Deltaproteobacteria bacterium]|nr:hypothetical protein [Deltaproteobacteria bacterium]